ncbi:MAG: ATPase, T2SS/T4P/T4SS family [Oligoflexales bacterium]
MLSHLLSFFTKPDVEEVYVNGNHGLAVLRKSKHEYFPVPSFFYKGEDFIKACQNLALQCGLRLDPIRPFAGGILKEEGLRWHCIIPPAAPRGPLFALRKHRFGDLTIDDFAGEKKLKCELMSLLENKTSLLFCGETGSGKTSLLAACLKVCALNDRVLIIEELEEVPLLGALWSKLLSKPESIYGSGALSMEMLFRECLRLRPDRMVLGELRGADFFCFLEAISSGHHGVFASFHAGSPSQLKQRLINANFDTRSLEELGVYGVFLERHNPCKITAIKELSRFLSTVGN